MVNKRYEYVSLWLITRNVTIGHNQSYNDKIKFLIAHPDETPENHFAIKLGSSTRAFCEAFKELHEFYLQKTFKFSPSETYSIKQDFVEFISLFEKEIENGDFE